MTSKLHARTQKRFKKTLADFSLGQEGTVLGLTPACQGPQRSRLLDLGIVPGTKVRVEMESLGRDPRAYFIRGALVALRDAQARWILVAENV